MNAPKSVVLSLLMVACGAMAHGVTVDATCTPQVTSLDARLVKKANEGPDALRSFIFIRRGIYSLDMRETADRVHEIEAARAACRLAAAAAPMADASTNVALK